MQQRYIQLTDNGNMVISLFMPLMGFAISRRSRNHWAT